MVHPGFRLVLVTSGILFAATQAHGQVSLTPRDLGMGGAYIGLARGQESLYLNPANLALPDAPRRSIAFPRGAVVGRLAGTSAGEAQDMLRYNDISISHRDAIFRGIPERGIELGIDLRLPFAAYQNGSWAAGISYGFTAHGALGRDIVELLLYGYESGRADYDVGASGGFQAAFWDVAAAYGVRVGPLSVGATGHYIHGETLMRSRLLDPEVDLAAQDIEVRYLGVQASGGHGLGVDVGAAYQPTPAWTLGVTIANAYASMHWSDEIRVRELVLNKDNIAETTDVRDLLDRYDASERPLRPADRQLAAGRLARELLDEAYFPTELRLGAGWRARPGTALGLSYRAPLTDGRLSSSWDRTLALGAQQRLPVVTLRAGLATNLDERLLVAGGLTVGPLDVGIAKSSEGEFGGGTRSAWIATVGLSLAWPGAAGQR